MPNNDYYYYYYYSYYESIANMDKFEKHCADRLSSNTRAAYDVEGTKLKTWLKNHSTFGSKCYRGNNLVLRNVTDTMLSTYVGTFTEYASDRGKRKLGDYKSVDYMWKLHASIKYLYSSANLPLPGKYEINFLDFITGFKNNHADAKQIGNCGSQASDRLTAEGYFQLAKLAISGDDKFFVHCFLIWGWNMFTRAGNTGDIKTGNDMLIKLKHFN